MNKKIKIVYAEDDSSIARLVTFRLAKEGFEVIHFTDGENVVQEIKNIQPKLILLDKMMPIKNGVSILKEIKADDSIKNIPVIFLTSEGQDDSIEECIQLGVEDYILKPFSTVELSSRIKNVLNRNNSLAAQSLMHTTHH